MKPARVFLLKGIERMIDHVKSLEELKCAYWRKSRSKKFQVGDMCFLYLSGKGHNQVRYCLEVADASCLRDDAVCWKQPYEPDNDCYKLVALYPMYRGDELSLGKLESLGINRATPFQRLNDDQVRELLGYFEK